MARPDSCMSWSRPPALSPALPPAMLLPPSAAGFRRHERNAQFAGCLLLVALLLLLPLQWITLARVGGFVIRLPYPILLFALIPAVLSLPARAGLLRMLRSCSFWLVPFLFYLLIAMLALHGSPGQGSPVRQVFFAAGSMALGGCVLAMRDPRPALRIGGLACLVGFPVVTEIIGRMQGVGWADAIGAFLAGDLDFVIYGFLRNIYNFFGEDSEFMVVASEKNAISASLLVGLFLFRAAGPLHRTDWPGMIVTALAIGLLLILNTRSVLLPLILALVLAPGLRLIRRPDHSPYQPVFWLTAGVILLALAGTQLMVDSPLRDLLTGRFSLTDASSGSRVTQQVFAVRQIEDALLTGNGYTLVNGDAVHNLFLGAFVQAGLAAFLLTVAFYLAVTFAWLRMIWRLASDADFGVADLRPEWIAMLPVLPLLRIWLTGDFGHPGLAEWVALVCFFALRDMGRSTARPR